MLCRGVLPPEEIPGDGVEPIILDAFVVEVQSEVGVEGYVSGVDELRACLADDYWEDVASIPSDCQSAPAGAGSVSESSSSVAAHASEGGQQNDQGGIEWIYIKTLTDLLFAIYEVHDLSILGRYVKIALSSSGNIIAHWQLSTICQSGKSTLTFKRGL